MFGIGTFALRIMAAGKWKMFAFATAKLSRGVWKVLGVETNVEGVALADHELLACMLTPYDRWYPRSESAATAE